MNKKIIHLLVAVFTFQLSMAQTKDMQINVMSFNIRMDNAGDGDNQWKFRKDFAADAIKFHDADLVGAQEVLHHQLEDLLERLPEYAYVGVGREDGKEKGEYSPVIYKKNRFSVVKNGDFWLSEDRNAVGKKGWDAACERIASWAVLKERETGKTFFILNTHLDHVGKIARKEGAALILEQAKQLSDGLPVIVTGDFNAKPDDEPIRILTDKDDVRHLIHSRELSPIKYGPEWTFHNYGKIPVEKRSWIDYIFVKGDIKVLRNGVLTDTYNQLYTSDHCPVLATLVL